jgi:subtilisin family serine protease
MTEGRFRPAWSAQFESEAIRELSALGPIGEINRDWAWGGSSGAGVKVAIIDSGIEADHPDLGTAVKGGVIVEFDEHGDDKTPIIADDPPSDLFGHGTACAGIIHSVAPEAEIYSVRVLGKDLTGKAQQFAQGLRWAIENEMDVINLSLSTSKYNFYAIFHKLADDAYFQNTVLISAVNNVPSPSYPSLYSSVISVAAHEGQDPFTFYYNPSPPVEFGAPGIDVKVAWLDGGRSTITGNSFAAKHPDLTPFQIKTILFACASNVQGK